MNNHETFINLVDKLSEGEKQFILQILLDLLNDIPCTIKVGEK